MLTFEESNSPMTISLHEDKRTGNSPIIKFKRLSQDALVPVRATSGSAGFDIYSIGYYTIKPNVRCLLDTGIAMQLPEGWWGELKPRSGLASKYGLDVLAGVIDSDYLGEIKVSLINLGEHDVEIKKGDRIAQLIIQRYESEWIEVEELRSTNRGGNGYARYAINY
jgi:dUTP pyrophosphatase